MKPFNPDKLESNLTLEQLQKMEQEWQDALSKNEDSFHKKSAGDFNAYSDLCQPYHDLINTINRRIRMIMPVELEEELRKDDDVMTLDEFKEAVKSGMFIDYDGHGRYVKDGRVTNVLIFASDCESKSIRKDFTEMVWYNR